MDSSSPPLQELTATEKELARSAEIWRASRVEHFLILFSGSTLPLASFLPWVQAAVAALPLGFGLAYVFIYPPRHSKRLWAYFLLVTGVGNLLFGAMIHWHIGYDYFR